MNSDEHSSLTGNIDSNDDETRPNSTTLATSDSQRGDPLSNYPSSQQSHGGYYQSENGHNGSQQHLAASGGNPFYDGTSGNPSYASGFNSNLGGNGMMQSDSTHYPQGYELEDEAKIPLTEKYGGYGNGGASQYK